MNETQIIKSGDQTILFPLVWLDESQRQYHASAFARGMTGIVDRVDFGVSWDLNPADGIKVELSMNPTHSNVETLVKRIGKFLDRQHAKEIIQRTGTFSTVTA